MPKLIPRPGHDQFLRDNSKYFFVGLEKIPVLPVCWGCQNLGTACSHDLHTQVYGLARRINQGIGVEWPTALAIEVANLHEVYRQRANECLGPDQPKVIEWNVATILTHWLHHGKDTAIRDWLITMLEPMVEHMKHMKQIEEAW